MNVGLIHIHQERPSVRCPFQQLLNLLDEGRTAFRIRTPEQLLGFLPR